MYSPYENGTVERIEVTPNEFIEVNIPPVPPIHLIQNFDLPVEQQKWVRTDYPAWWDEAYEMEMDYRIDNDDYRDKKCEEFRRQEWNRRLNGHWCFIKGNPVYIPGKYYYYLNWIKNDNGYPKFRETDRKEFLFTQYCFEDPKCLGYIKIGPRGFGKTVKEVAITLEEMTKVPRRRQAAIQSKTKDDAKDKIFAEKMVPAYVELPEFFKPESDHGTKPEGKLSFFRQAVRGKNAKKIKQDEDAELKNTVYPVPAKEKTLDGGTYAIIIQDEIGKCLKKGTRVLMFDGSFKNVEDVAIGDILMGDDSTPRKVQGLGRGSEMCYDIVSNKWNTWGCNESHILSLKVCSDNIIRGYKKNETINISVKNYLSLTKTQQRHLMLYKVGVEYKENNHLIPPYFLGLWLGDGSKNRFKIHNVDKETEEALIDLSSTLGLSYKKYTHNKNCPYHVLCDDKSPKAGLTSELARLSLVNNKHIPHNYLIDSRENRLQLLAGLIDSDGHKSSSSRNYEITQKIKLLADNILTLAQSLGFGASLMPKMATLKRKDGTVYSCKVYRINIFGDSLHEIPCKIKRKKFNKINSPHINTRNTLRSGFRVIPTGVENYYGFSIDGNKLFIIEDFQVTHNTNPKEEADVNKRWQVNRFCVYRDHEKRGMILGTSTIEEMKEGGAECFLVWKNSDSRVLTDNGFTISGAYRYFTSCLDVTYFDEFGYSDKDKAKVYHDAERRARRDDLNELASYIRKNPYNPEEAFMEDADGCEFNAFLLSQREQELDLKDPTTMFDLEWTAGRDSKVKFEPNPRGKFCVSWLPTNESETNLVEPGPSFRRSDGTIIPTWKPKNDLKFRIGCDPVMHGIETVDKRVSDSAAYVFRMYDLAVDNNVEEKYTPKDCDDPNDYKLGRFKWKTYLPVVEYIYRNDDPDDFFEDMIKLCRFFGCQILVENQKNGIINKFNDRGYRDFIMYRPKDTFTSLSGTQNTPGLPGVDPVIQQYLGEIKTYIMQHGHRIPFKRLIKDLIRFRRKNIKIHDPTVAFGVTLLSLKGEAKTPRIPIEITSLIRTYNNSGTESIINRN
jgi:hypothetical protein